MDAVTGYVERITYRNEETGYTVLQVKTGAEETCLVGRFLSIAVGETLKAEGEFVTHPTYGPQLRVEHYEFLPPEDEAATERYLGSGAIKGIGAKLAHRIVEKFGADTFRIIEEEPERLSEVRGISERSAMELAAQIIEKREARNTMLFLQQYGITVTMAAKIYRRFGTETYAILKENPYRLAEEVRGIGFRTADAIALKMNVPMDSEYRIRAAALFVLQEAAGNGNTYLPKDMLIAGTEGLLSMQVSDFDHLLQDLAVSRKVRVVRSGYEERVYLASLYVTEQNTALRLKEMNLTDETVTDEEVFGKLALVEKESRIALDPLQAEAVRTAAGNGVTIITGGPGTGKTTTINALIGFFIREGMDLLLAAPTGRAAKRMTEATGYEALTVHRMLEAEGNPEDGERVSFKRTEDRPLEADVIIVDEMSMVDIFLMNALLRALTPGMRLILVGDADQLPSVGPGNVLRDLIDSDCFPVVRLNKIFRQSENSRIIVNAHKINAGEAVPLEQSDDFIFVKRELPGEIMGATVTLLKDKLPKHVHARTEDLQVLCPMKKGPLGVENMNRELQAAFNPKTPGKREREFGDRIFREGDKVMQIRNDYDLEWEIPGTVPRVRGKGVFNGDIGFIREINYFAENLTVEFEEKKTAVYPFSECDSLELAYAVTIHKSQGSEYPAVILPLHSGPDMLMNRNLLYTAVTRAKACVVIVGRYPTFLRMIENHDRTKRLSGLKEMIITAHELY